MILTLEPVNLTGIRSGFKQVEASIIGALITGIILALFGYYPWTAALAITATLYVSLVINWRQFSVVAVFTSIYMTQYVQLDQLGNPSEFETFKLRIAALLTGVIIAMLVNFLFSVVGYKHMLEKRIYHLINDLKSKITSTDGMLREKNYENANLIMSGYASLFDNINWIYGTILDYQKDPLVMKNETKRIRLEKILKMTALIREMAHVSYDVCFRVTKGDHHYKEEEFITDYSELILKFDHLLVKLEAIIHNKEVINGVILGDHTNGDTTINLMNESLQHMDHLLMHY
jgi:uncharacterized membrane protein YgaE (UPF0421/DUF939 family)